MNHGVTRVRVRPEGKGHCHHNGCAVPDDAVLLAGRPEWIAIYATPVEPDALTLCDTRYLWRVPDEEVVRLFGQPPSRYAPYVCEHQVEID